MTKIIRQNKWESLFDDFMDLTEFSLVKYRDGWGLIDNQGVNIGDIQSDRFDTAQEIFDRMDIYFNDYIYSELKETWIKSGFDEESHPTMANDWLKYREARGFEDSGFYLDILDMVANHYDEIDLNNCTYERN